MAPRQETPSAAPGPEAALPGRLSALLREVARAPSVEKGATPPISLRPGVAVGRFELVRELGRGGFGVVYEARDRELGRSVAVKLIRPGRQPDLREERLLLEAEAAAGLSHPNIVTLHDAGRCEHGPFLVLELLRGQTLAQRLDQGPLSVREALRVAVEAARGLAHAHAKGIVHRDLKPSNLFLCEDGAVKLLDLGMAHAFGRRRLDGGTPGYMAPEQQRGAPEDERTDVYALGVILHRMLADEPPYSAPRARPAESVPQLEVPGAPALGALVARMLDPDPVKRPRDAGEVLPALSSCQEELQRSGEPIAAAPVRRRRYLALRRRAFLGTALLGLLVAAGWLVGRMLLSPGSAQVAPSIAVLPFADVSPQRDQEYFSDGLADEILNLLNRVEGLRVPSRTSSFYFKGRNAPLAEIGRELRVAAVLEGSVRTSGNRVRVSAQVVNVADGFRQWAATYDRELTDIFTVQDEIAQAVVAALDQKLLGGKALAASDRETGPEAYRLCLLGRQRAYLFTAGSLRLAAEAFEAALAIDPRYAPAWSGLAMALYHLSNVASTPAEISSLRRRAVAAAEKAVALSPNLPEALSTRGNLRGIVEHDWEGARRDLEGALAVNGNDSASRRRYATLLAVLGRLPEAIEQARKAADLDPLGEAWSRLGFLYQNAGELDLAAAAFRRDLAIHPGSLSGLVGLGRNLVLQGKAKEALALVRESPERVDRLFVQAAAHHLLGDRAASQAALEEMIATEAQTAALDIAEIHALRGESEAALGWLERSVLQRDGGLGIGLQTDPFLRSLRSRPRFLALLQKMNLPAPAEQPAPPK